MVGSFGCGCERCQGTGTIALQLRSKLCALERLLGVEMVVKVGYRCGGLSVSESAHSSSHDGEGVAMAVDFFPRSPVTISSERLEMGGKKWGNRRFDFLELARPFFDRVWIHVEEGDHSRWSIHGEIEGTDAIYDPSTVSAHLE